MKGFLFLLIILVSCNGSEKTFEPPKSYAEISLLAYSSNLMIGIGRKTVSRDTIVIHPDSVRAYLLNDMVIESAKKYLDKKEDAIYLANFEDCIRLIQTENGVFRLRFHHEDGKKAIEIVNVLYDQAKKNYIARGQNRAQKELEKIESKLTDLKMEIEPLAEELHKYSNFQSYHSLGYFPDSTNKKYTYLTYRYDSLREELETQIEMRSEYKIIYAGMQVEFPFLIIEKGKYFSNN